MNGMDNTTHQLRYPVEDATTQGQMAVPAARGIPGTAGMMPPPPEPVTSVMGTPTIATPREPASGRVQAPAEPSAAPVVPPPWTGGTGRGRTRISDEVVERVIQKIVDLTVESVEGVQGLRPEVDRFFAEAAGTGSEPGAHSAPDPAGPAAAPAPAPATRDRAVAVSLAGDRATINLAIEVGFGYAVHDLVEQVRGAVITSSERLLGLTVAEVNVAVCEVSFDAPPGPEQPGGPADPGPEQPLGPVAGRRPRHRP